MNRTGKIIHYNQNDGKGIVNADGQTYPFDVSLWRGSESPRLNGPVRLEMGGDGVLAVHPAAGEAQQLAEMGGQLGKALGQHGNHIGQQLLAVHGIPTLVAYALFLLGGTALTFVTFKSLGLAVPLHSLDRLMNMFGSSNTLTLLLFWVGVVAMIAPLFIRHRLTSLLLGLPLTATLVGFYDTYRIVSAAQAGLARRTAMLGDMMAAFSGRGGAVRELPTIAFSDVVGLGAGFYCMLIAGLFLAWIGFRQYRQQ
ncbi:hypothetical protein [Chitiniphilus eburneus]|uniref:Uncharacterized protein n=1 Tax=Chitiniphilus eburneus TaxID=2571148 RepID=A0A4U0PY67_9NEIS|nr:hypothetical protein [Chitiniphilus eburneus]TJZ73200.1 hypothetical protein FAZ21_11320 [Chitiniphilus eburneus]